MVSATSNVDDLWTGGRAWSRHPRSCVPPVYEMGRRCGAGRRRRTVGAASPRARRVPGARSVARARKGPARDLEPRTHDDDRVCGSCSAVRRSGRWRRSKRSALRSSAASTSRSCSSRSALTRLRSSCHGFRQLSTHGWGLVGGIPLCLDWSRPWSSGRGSSAYARWVTGADARPRRLDHGLRLTRLTGRSLNARWMVTD